jgi:hypothetical protein
MSGKLWARLGFGEKVARFPGPDVVEGFAPGNFHTAISFDVPWADRLRLLVSGRLAVGVAVRMDLVPKRIATIGAFGILPPR